MILSQLLRCFVRLSGHHPLIAYTTAWSTLLVATVAIATFFPEVAFTEVFSPESYFSRSCGGNHVRVPGDDVAWEVVCIPARLFQRSILDLLVPPVFAVLVVGCSATFVHAIGLWEIDDDGEEIE